jgi:glycosyltransferase involved in cell wall biosynthesis
MIEKPLVSIVTPSYNMARYLRETIESVLAQDYPHIDYIVMDGGSTDGTLAILEQYQDRLRYVSAPDSGAADAINRGFEMSQGSILAWLNADDVYLPGAISKAVRHLITKPDLGAVHGEANWVDGEGKIIGRYPTRPCVAAELSQDCCVCQPACFFRREAFQVAGGLDPALNSAFDYDLWIRMAKQIRFGFIPSYLAGSRMHEANKTLGQRDAVFRESFRILKCGYGYIPFSWVHSRCGYFLDGRDQFYDPIRPSVSKYCLSLPVGLWYNRNHPLRYWREWASVMSAQALARRWNESWLAGKIGSRRQ